MELLLQSTSIIFLRKASWILKAMCKKCTLQIPTNPIDRHNTQEAPIAVKISTAIHDRFLLIDNEIYHIGASLKDLGKKLFAFSKMKMTSKELLRNI